jgi:hypothetical protein
LLCYLTDSEADGSTSRSGSSKKNNAFLKKNPALHSSNAQDRIDELAEGINVLSKRLSRRQAISTGVGVAAGVVGGLVIGGAAGYLAKPSTGATTISTATVTSPPVTSTITSTLTSTLTTTLSSVSSSATVGPGIDYYWEPSLSGLTVNYVAGSAPEHVTIDPTFALFTKETGITVNEDLTTACVGTIGANMFAAGSNEYDVLDAGLLAAQAYTWWKSNYIVPWSNFFDITPAGWNSTDVLPLLQTACSTYPTDDPANVLLCLPLNLAINCMYYNLADWSGAGFDTPLPGTVQLDGNPTSGQPVTYDEIMPTLNKLQGNGKYSYNVETSSPVSNIAYGQTIMWTYGANWLTKDFTPNFTNQNVMDGFQLYLDLSQKFCPDPINMNDAEWSSLGSSGEIISGQWTYNAYDTIFGSGSAEAPATFPACLPPAVNNSATFIAGQCPVINAFSSSLQQKAAWSLISFMSSPRMMTVYNGMGTTGWRPSVVASPAATAAANGNYALQWAHSAALELANGGLMGGSAGSNNTLASEIFIKMPDSLTLVLAVGNELAKVQAGNETLAQGMENLQTSTVSILQQAGVYNTSYPFGT